MLRGIPVANGQYAGSPFGWLHPFAILTGIGLVLGYALLGAGWLVLKSDGALRDWAYGRIQWLAAGVLAALFVAFAVTFDYSILARGNLHARPWGLVFPVIGVLALAGLAVGVHRRRHDAVPRCDSCSTAAWWSCPSSPRTRSASTGSFAGRFTRATVEGPAEGSRQARRRKH
jgi:cytochrome bd-type quinol oxidase subunit 2